MMAYEKMLTLFAALLAFQKRFALIFIIFLLKLQLGFRSLFLIQRNIKSFMIKIGINKGSFNLSDGKKQIWRLDKNGIAP
ncbi:hypothetical protein [Ruminococcus sp.]|uniref:hypothetical protein n=1 Tax=Ruminococcus sp. TaxID=41978 RepID=UPI0025DCE9E5|nr:hypothetical protein [Ruminococcus sp.]